MATLLLTEQGGIRRVRLNRPEVRNALNDELVRDLQAAFEKMAADPAARVVILSGQGGYFCAGADLNWMKSFVGASREINEKDAREFSRLLKRIDSFPKPIIAQVQGAAIGGGVGLVSVADIVIAEEETVFALAEVKLGLIPAVISPYLIAKMGVAAARRYFLTGERFDAGVAQRYGLVHEAVELDDLESRTEELAKELLSAGPEAVKACKDLIRELSPAITPELENYTVQKIVELRISPEGQEGIQAFLEKRKPRWNI